MYKTSTYFIKGQIPNTSSTELLQFYKQELEDQSVSNIQLDGNILTFSNDNVKFVANRYANKFSSFTSGQISIEDNSSEYLVIFEADNSRTFTVAGIISGAITLFFLIISNFDLSSLIIGLIMFVVVSVVGYGITIVSFPIYFTSIRNDIESLIQARQTNYR